MCGPCHIPNGLRHVETEIGKRRAATGARKPPVQDQKLLCAASRMPSSFRIQLETYSAIRNQIRCMAVPGYDALRRGRDLQGQVGPETSNNIIEKGLASRRKQSGSVVASTGY